MPGHLVFVTGASSGIGLALARAVPWKGARVVDISRRGAPGLEHVRAAPEPITRNVQGARVVAAARRKASPIACGAAELSST